MHDVLDPALTGVPMYGTPYVVEGQMISMCSPDGRDAIYFHRRLSRKRKWRRKHGRARNTPRRMVEKKSWYQPDFDRLKA